MSDDKSKTLTYDADDTCKTLTFTVNAAVLGEDCLGVDMSTTEWTCLGVGMNTTEWTMDGGTLAGLEFDYHIEDSRVQVDPNMAYLAALPEGMPVVILTPQSKLEVDALRALVYDAEKNAGSANSSWPAKWRAALEEMNTWQAIHGEGGLTPPETD